LPETGLGEAETVVLGRGGHDRYEDYPEYLSCPRVGSGEAELWVIAEKGLERSVVYTLLCSGKLPDGNLGVKRV
jgi:hypothetical protein